MNPVRPADVVHDVSLLAWIALAGMRATGRGRPGPVEAAVVVVNLVSGTPAAWRRVQQRRRDVVALAAPVAVGCAVVATARQRPRWAAVAATTTLLVLRLVERARMGRAAATPRVGDLALQLE